MTLEKNDHFIRIIELNEGNLFCKLVKLIEYESENGLDSPFIMLLLLHLMIVFSF